MVKLNGSFINFHENPKKLIFLFHGYGDHAENFLPLGEYLNDSNFEANFFAPNAPFIVPQYASGRQWFDPYPNGIHYNEIGPEQKKIMKQECEVSIKQLNEYINDICSSNKLSYSDCFLIGFSQGAMIAYEFGNNINKKFAGCVMMSGRILSAQNLANNLFVKTPLLIIHGDKDETVNPKYYTEACQSANSSHFIVENYLIKEEGHTISSEMLKLVQNFIEKYV